MKFDELFEQRSLVASKLKDCIRDMGYTKVSFASKADISRPTLVYRHIDIWANISGFYCCFLV